MVCPVLISSDSLPSGGKLKKLVVEEPFQKPRGVLRGEGRDAMDAGAVGERLRRRPGSIQAADEPVLWQPHLNVLAGDEIFGDIDRLIAQALTGEPNLRAEPRVGAGPIQHRVVRGSCGGGLHHR